MSRRLLSDPLWRGEDLGRPVPDSPHAVSVALPRWADVVGYEEKQPEVMARLAGGYPRFVIHSKVAELARAMGGGRPCLPFPSAAAAAACADFVRSNGGGSAEVIFTRDAHAVVVSEAGQALLKAFWQHTGLITSSRRAAACLEGAPESATGEESRRELRRVLAGLYECGEEDVFLTPSGMAAQHAALKAVQGRRPGLRTAQLGFPYVDTLKLQEKFGAGAVLLHDLGSMAADLRWLLERSELAGCFCEIPGNPMLGSADVREISPVLRARGVPLVADDVVATPFNVDLGPWADLVATSLTKFVAGTGDVMGGALVCNPRSPYYAELKALARAGHEELLWGGDADVLARQARGFRERMAAHNRNGLLLAERLRTHPAVERVYYPKWEFAQAYEAVRRPQGGWGALITFLPKNAAVESPRIYDRMRFCKGPSLGTVFTLACPFTLLAHYTELDWAESCGVSRHLIRISAGLEDPEDLWTRMDQALRG